MFLFRPAGWIVAAAVICSLGSGLVATARAAVYYVAPSGHDADPGTQTNPWKTLAKAAATLVAGDSVFIRGGVYNERLIPENSGTAEGHIAFAAFPGEQPVLDGMNAGIDDPGGLVDIRGKAYIKISGLKVMNTGPSVGAAGIYVRESRYIVIEKNHTFHTNSSGIKVEMNCSHIVIDGNDVEDSTYSGNQECISLAYWIDHFEIKNNVVHDASPDSFTGAEGIDVKSGVSNGKIYHNRVHHVRRVGIYVDAYALFASNIEIYGNVVRDMHITGLKDIPGSGIVVACETGGTVENVRIYNNLCYNNPLNGILLADWDDGGAIRHPVSHVTVANNTCYRNGRGISVTNDDAREVVIRNNILSENSSDQIYLTVPMESLTVDHNLVNGPNRFSGDAVIEADPAFRDSDAGEFRLLASSPAVNSGSSVDVPVSDFDGILRPLGTGYDLGAFEFGTPSDSPPGLLSFDTSSLSEDDLGSAVIRVSESSKIIQIPVVRTQGSAGPAGLHASIVDGTAVAGQDYVASDSDLAWADGETGARNLAIQILDDDLLEVPETLSVRLENAQGATLSPPNTIVITIVSDEPLPGLDWEAESGIISAPFITTCGVVTQYVRTSGPLKGGRASYRFVVPTAGPYIVEALIAASKLANPPGEIYVNMDGEPTGTEMIWDVPGDIFYRERRVSWRGSGTRKDDEFVPKIFQLTAGEHELIMRGIRWGLRVDRVRVLPWSPGVAPPTAPGGLRIRPEP